MININNNIECVIKTPKIPPELRLDNKIIELNIIQIIIIHAPIFPNAQTPAPNIPPL